ncbi:hypothetical protein [Streptococcus devriesei]|uniref:hypothetical protein n=1 Tax=Streptococcus devriesei TaxID=231233 RepID=UPI0004249F1F|nr:hypothetical protein [Streptococcus devriesei]
MGELAIKNDKLAKVKEVESSSLDVELLQNKRRNLEQISNYLSAIVNSYNEIKQNINPEEMYVVKFTQEQLKKFQNGEIDFQKTADRKSLLPNFVTRGTNNNIVSKARLEKIVLDNPEALQNVMSNVNQLVNAQKINDLEILLSEVKQIGLDIKQGQKDDRRAKILGAESTINHALMMSNDNRHKQFLLLNAVSQLNEGREALIKEFENEVSKQIAIPTSKIRLFLKSSFDDKFNENVSKSFFELNDQFSYIVKASDLLAKTYSVTGNGELVDIVYLPVKSLVEKHHEYVSKLVELQDLDGEEHQRQMKWCIEPNEFIAQIGTTELSEDDVITIEFTGKELLKGEIQNG